MGGCTVTYLWTTPRFYRSLVFMIWISQNKTLSMRFIFTKVRREESLAPCGWCWIADSINLFLELMECDLAAIIRRFVVSLLQNVERLD